MAKVPDLKENIRQLKWVSLELNIHIHTSQKMKISYLDVGTNILSGKS